MKKILIVILILLILLLAGAWVYLLLNGTPKNVADIRDSLFGGGKTSTLPTVGDFTPEQPPQAEESAPRTLNTTAPLVKLTERKVAGATLATVTAGEVVRYIEKGTGYVFEIPLVGGIETRLSNRVIQNVVDAQWSSDGIHVVLTTDIDGTRGETLLGTLPKDSTGSLETATLGRIDNAAFSKDSTSLFYTEKNTSFGTSAFRRDLTTDAVTTLFTLPFNESAVLWDIWNAEKQYVYTKPAQGFTGYLYLVTTNALEKVAEGVQLTASRPDEGTLLINYISGAYPQSTLLSRVDDTQIPLTIQTLPEKCAGGPEAVWCGASDAENTSSFPLAWYQGTVSYSDSLYRIARTTGESSVKSDLESQSREQLDVTDLTAGEGGALLFKNKRDDALWLANPQ